MERIRKIVKEVHLYANKIETLIRFAIWLILWVGGILVLRSSADKKSMGSAYFIFALSLLMEFAPKIREKNDIFSKFIHTVFCTMMLLILFIATMILFGMELKQNCYDVMFGLSAAIMVFMFFDFLIFWLDTEYINVNEETNIQRKDKDIETVHKELELFKKYLYYGTLGDIEKGEQKDE